MAKGRVDGMNPRKLVDMIRQKTNVNPRKINDVRIFDKFSFITVLFRDAETILHAFNQGLHNRRSIVVRAKEKKRKF